MTSDTCIRPFFVTSASFQTHWSAGGQGGAADHSPVRFFREPFFETDITLPEPGMLSQIVVYAQQQLYYLYHNLLFVRSLAL